MWTLLSGEFCFKESSNISPNFVLLRRQRNAHWHNRIKSGKTDTAAAVSCDFFVSQKKPWGGRLPNKGGAKKRNWRARRLSPDWKGQRQVIYFILKISLTQLIINSFKSLISSGSLKPILIVLWTRNIRRVKKCPEITIVVNDGSLGLQIIKSHNSFTLPAGKAAFCLSRQVNQVRIAAKIITISFRHWHQECRTYVIGCKTNVVVKGHLC